MRTTFMSNELTKFAQEIGADAAMVIVPYYNRPSQAALYKHFKAVDEAVDIPIIVYNIPGRTAVTMMCCLLKRIQALSKQRSA